MSKKKFFLSAGAVVLFIAGIFAEKVRTRFVVIQTLYYKTGGFFGSCVSTGIHLSAAGILVTSGAGLTCQAKLTTQGCTNSAPLYFTSTCSASSVVITRLP